MRKWVISLHINQDLSRPRLRKVNCFNFGQKLSRLDVHGGLVMFWNSNHLALILIVVDILISLEDLDVYPKCK